MSLLAEQDLRWRGNFEELDRQRNSIELIASGEFHQPCRHAGHGQHAYQ